MSVGLNDCGNDEAIARALQAEWEREAAFEEQERIAAVQPKSLFDEWASKPPKASAANRFKVNEPQTARQNGSKTAHHATWKSPAHATSTAKGSAKPTSSFREAEDEALALRLVQDDIEQIRQSSDHITDELILQTQKLALTNGVNDSNVTSLLCPPAWSPLDAANNSGVNNTQTSDPFQFSLRNENMPPLSSFNSNTSSSSDSPLPTLLMTIDNGIVNSPLEASRRLYERFQPATAVDAVQADGPVVHPRIVTCASPPISPSPPSSNAPWSLETVRRLGYVVDSSVMPPPNYLESSSCTRANRSTAADSSSPSARTLANGRRNGSGQRADESYQTMYDEFRARASRKRGEALVVQRGSVGKHPAASAVQRQRADKLRAEAAEEDTKAGWAIVYFSNRPRRVDQVDLHGLHQADLPHVLPHIIRQKHEQLKPGMRLEIITGIGNNSRVRRCVVRSRVMEFCRLNKIRVEEDMNGGILRIPMPNVLPKLDAALFFGDYGDE